MKTVLIAIALTLASANAAAWDYSPFSTGVKSYNERNEQRIPTYQRRDTTKVQPYTYRDRSSLGTGWTRRYSNGQTQRCSKGLGSYTTCR